MEAYSALDGYQKINNHGEEVARCHEASEGEEKEVGLADGRQHHPHSWRTELSVGEP